MGRREFQVGVYLSRSSIVITFVNDPTCESYFALICISVATNTLYTYDDPRIWHSMPLAFSVFFVTVGLPCMTATTMKASGS